MNWITDYVRPKLQRASAEKKTETPENLWQKCPSCEQMLFHRDLADNLYVCPSCNYHLRLDVAKRLELLFDPGEMTVVTLPAVPQDPLKFKDTKKYSERLKEYRAKSGREDALMVAHGKVEESPLVAAVFDFSFMGGSMGMAVGEGILTAAELAVKLNYPLLIIPASGGARMQEGVLSLMQMPRTTIAVQMLREAGLPYIVLLTNPTTGGVSASFAMLGDITFAEPGATIGFTGARVIQETIREKLPPGFQTAEYLKSHGMIDAVLPRKELRPTLGKVLRLLRKASSGK